MRLRDLHEAKNQAQSVKELLSADAVAGIFRQRRDKLSGHVIWQQTWHHFMALKKGQSFRCKIVKTKKINGLWQTQWARHQKRYMSMKMDEFHQKVLTWEPYLRWRETYLAKNPKLPNDWHVGVKRLYKEKCFCIDEEEAIRKCGCEVHLKMAELIAGLQRWRRAVSAKIKKDTENSHTCTVGLYIIIALRLLCVTNSHLLYLYSLAGL